MQLKVKMMFLFCLSALLTSCGGGGDSNSSDDTVNNVLFAYDHGNEKLSALETFLPENSDQLTANILDGNSYFGHGLALDKSRDLLYATQGTFADRDTISVFNGASRLKGRVSANRIIIPVVPAGLNRDDISHLVLDSANDRLYVGLAVCDPIHGTCHGALAVFNNASTVSGNAVPDRYIRFSSDFRFVIDFTRDILYTYQYTYGQVFSYHHFSEMTAEVFEQRRSMVLISGSPTGIALDTARDRLYIGITGIHSSPAGDSGIKIVNNASSQGYTSGQSPTYLPGDIVRLNLPMLYTGSLNYNPSSDVLYAAFGTSVYVFQTASGLSSSSSAINAKLLALPSGSEIKNMTF